MRSSEFGNRCKFFFSRPPIGIDAFEKRLIESTIVIFSPCDIGFKSLKLPVKSAKNAGSRSRLTSGVREKPSPLFVENRTTSSDKTRDLRRNLLLLGRLTTSLGEISGKTRKGGRSPPVRDVRRDRDERRRSVEIYLD